MAAYRAKHDYFPFSIFHFPLNNYLCRVKRFLLLFIAVISLGSCIKDDQIPARQQKDFESYLAKTDSYAGELPCDTLDGVWRLLENPREEREDEPQATVGSEVEIYFEGYVFTSSIDLDPMADKNPMPFYTNRADIIAAIEAYMEKELLDDGIVKDVTFDPSLWPTAPMVGRLGGSGFFKGLDKGLRGAYKNDRLLLLITSENGYGSSDIGGVIKDSPLIFRVYVNDVK